MKRIVFLFVLSLIQVALRPQSVIFPQEQQAGKAFVAHTDDEVYEIGNDLFCATYIYDGGHLLFGGCRGMGLQGSTELFDIALQDGTRINASDMSLKKVDIRSNDGEVALVATFISSRFDVEWRAVLRDGSHYLRTEMDIIGNENVSMHQLTPMIYDVTTTSDPASVPAVVGNTRGAVVASDRIFAGLETPMGLNTADGVHDSYSNFTPRSWTPDSFHDNVIGGVPQGVASSGYAPLSACGYVYIPKAGSTRFTFNYTSGTHRLDILGVDIVGLDGQVQASDYHIGYTGGNQYNKVYTLDVPAAGYYLLRYFVTTEIENLTLTSSGTVSISPSLKIPEIVFVDELPEGETLASINAQGNGSQLVLLNSNVCRIRGVWHRHTTLAKGDMWRVSAVVGLIAPGQARRSFLAYSERERAVPWRPMPCYISWYELNIDRNNAANYTGNMTIDQCVDVMRQWKTNLYDKYGEAPSAFVWDDGWDNYGTWTFNPNFPNGFSEVDNLAREMGTGIGAWLGPVGGYGTSGNYRRQYWTSRGQKMELSNPDYYKVFWDACNTMISNYDFRFFKFDGISAQWSAVGPDAGDTGVENAEGIISMEQRIRTVKPDIFFNTTVGTWASPFWFHVSDAVWRQENDYGTIGNQGSDRERWITYRDRLVYQNFVQNSPLCPINTLMTHGVILTKYGDVAKDMDYKGIVREIRCAFGCGSGMVELYTDYSLLNSIRDTKGQAGALWGEIAQCMKWQRDNADVLPDIHWVGGNPWDGSKANIYGWAAWNGVKSVVTLRNPAASRQALVTTLREVLDIPSYINTTVTLSKAFADQAALNGITENTPIDIDAQLTISMPASSVYVFNGVDNAADAITDVSPSPVSDSAIYDLSGRRIQGTPAKGSMMIVNGRIVKNKE